jgi:hypothetical protein
VHGFAGIRQGKYKVEIWQGDVNTKKVLWSDVQNSRRLVGNYNRNIQEYMMHVNAVVKNVINNLREKLQRK